MTPKHRSIVREGWQALGQKGSASNANPFSKSGIVAGTLQEWIGQNHPVEAAEMRLEANPEGLTNDAQCVLDGTLNPDDVSDDVLQNLFEYNGKYAKRLIQQEKALVDQRINSGNATLMDRMQLEATDDPRAEEIKARDDAARSKAKQDQATVNASLRMQSLEQSRNQLKADAMAAGRYF